MADYDDKKLGTIFPTRFGKTIGGASERSMLDVVQGGAGIRTRLKNNYDGSVTTMRTHNGMPRFVTPEESGQKTCFESIVHANHGFVDTTFNFNAMFDETSLGLQQLIDEDGAVTPEENLYVKDSHDWKEKFHGLLPSNFSGLMRQVMQLRHGETRVAAGRPYQISANEICPIIGASNDEFSCSYSLTHGLFVAVTGKRFVIEVSAEGIFRIPISFLKEFTDNNISAAESIVFGAADSYQAGADAVAEYWTVTKFKRALREKIGDAPSCYAEGYSPWYSWCGWAFNYLGTAATVAVARGNPSEATWYQAALCDLAITVDGATGEPVAATSATSATSALAHNINDYDDNENAFIQASMSLPGRLETISLHSPISVAGQSIHAPIFSYYTAGGEKRVYYFDVFQSAARNETVSQPDSQTITISRTGTWTVGNIAAGSGYEYPTSGGAIDVPASYEVTVKQISEGIVSEQFNGTGSGWCGFSGASLPAQNTDFSGSYSYTARTTGPSGFAAPAGYSTMHVSRLSYVGIGPVAGQVVDWGYLLPSQDQNYFGAMPVTTVIEYSSTTHYRSDTHKSTILLHGYDRESIGFAYSKTSFESACVESGGYPSADGMIIPSGTLTMARENTPMNTWTGGVDDWGAYGMQDGQYGPAIPSKITGWYDWSPYIGVVATAYRRVNDHVNNPANFEDSGMAIPGIYEVIPEKNTTIRTLYVFVGSSVYTENISHNDFHQTYLNGESFRFWAGKSCTRNAVFYSADINQKPKVINVGSYSQAQRSLFGFIGVF